VNIVPWERADEQHAMGLRLPCWRPLLASPRDESREIKHKNPLTLVRPRPRQVNGFESDLVSQCGHRPAVQPIVVGVPERTAAALGAVVWRVLVALSTLFSPFFSYIFFFYCRPASNSCSSSPLLDTHAYSNALTRRQRGSTMHREGAE
jgi:hypothetical protein